jgi:succinoglycan biosynthesis transport protein ExoP
VELKQYLSVLRRWWWLVVLLAGIGGGGGYAFYRYTEQRQEPVYQATTTLLLSGGQQNLPDVEAVSTGSRLAETYAELMLKRSVLETVIVNLDLARSPDQVARSVTINGVSGTNLLELSVWDTNPQRAADIANEIARVFIGENQVQQVSRYQQSREDLQGEIDQVQQQIGDLRSQSSQINTDLASVRADLNKAENEIDSITKRLEDIPTEIVLKQTRIDGINALPSNQRAGYSIELRVLTQEIIDLQAEQARLEDRLPVLQAQVPELEAEIADYISEQGPIDVQLEQAQTRYRTLLGSYEDVRLKEAEATDFMSVVNPALPGSLVRNIQPWYVFTFQGVMAGLTVAVGIIVLIEYLNDTVRTSEEAERITGVPTLGVIGRIHSADDPREALVTAYKPRAPITESYRVLRANLEFAGADGPFQTVLVTSSGPIEGKTTTAANLAVSMAQAGKQVIIVDMDLRRPSLHKVFQKHNKLGVTTALLGGDAGQHLAYTEIPNLRILTSGPLPPNPADLFQSTRMADLLAMLKREADIVVFDTPPIMPVADPILLARLCDVVVLVVLADSTRVGILQKAREQLDQAGAHLVGVVMNKVSASKNGYYYYQQYYYYSSEEE